MSSSFQELANFIWSVADLLRGPYRPPQYERVMLPMTVLRRFDCVLEPTKAAVVQRWKALQDGKVKNLDPILNKVAGRGEDFGFHNHSELDFQRLKGDPNNIGRHLTDYIAGFSENVRKIFDYFEFEKEIEKLEEANRLYLVVSKFAEIDLHPRRDDNATFRRFGGQSKLRCQRTNTKTGTQHRKRADLAEIACKVCSGAARPLLPLVGNYPEASRAEAPLRGIFAFCAGTRRGFSWSS